MSDPVRQSPPVPRTWTVLSMIEWSRDYLADRGFDEGRLHAELLLAHVLKLNRLQLYLQFDRPLTQPELDAYRGLFKRRLAHEPLQYILGETEFMGLKFVVGPGVLVPRPETELLVERAMEIIKSHPRHEVRLLDVGVGSGNISLAIAHHAPNAKVTGIDASEQALAIARQNATSLNLTPELRHADVFDANAVEGPFEMIVSNPPYIGKAEFETLMPEVRLFEPRQALTDEDDGFGFLKRLAPRVAGLLVPGGTFLCEIGHGQEEGAHRIVESAGFVGIVVHKDYAGIPRVLEALSPHADRTA